MSFYREQEHTSRKVRFCDGCRGRIEIGERYRSIVGLDSESQFGANSYHPDCHDVEKDLNRINGLSGDDWMLLSEHVSEGGNVVLDGAPVAVRARFELQPEETAGTTSTSAAGREPQSSDTAPSSPAQHVMQTDGGS